MRSSKLFIIPLAFILLIAPSSLCAANWSKHNTKHFVIHHKNLNTETLNQITADAEKAYESLIARVWKPLEQKVDLFVYNNKADFIRSLNDIENISLKSAFARPNKFEINGFAPLSEDTITHELNHIFLYQMNPSANIPAWFDEGFATLLAAKDSSGTQFNVKDKLAKNIALPIKRPGGNNAETIMNFYNLGESRVGYLYDTLGKDGLLKLLKLIEKNGNFEKSLSLASRGKFKNLNSFNRQWQAYVNEYDSHHQRKVDNMVDASRSGTFRWYTDEQEKIKYIEDPNAWSQTAPRNYKYIFEGELKDNKPIGEVKGYLSDGRTLYKISHYKDGAKDGEETIYDYKGNVKAVQNYKEGRKHGENKYFETDGRLSYKVNYFNDTKDGEEVKYRPNGSLLSRSRYKMGELVFEESEDLDGNKSSEIVHNLEDGTTKITNWNKKKLFSERNFKNSSEYEHGMPHGPQIQYYDNGAVKKMVHHDNSQQIFTKYYYDNGQLKTEIYHRERGKHNSMVRDFYQSGQIKEEVMYDEKGVAKAIRIFKEDGSPADRTMYLKYTPAPKFDRKGNFISDKEYLRQLESGEYSLIPLGNQLKNLQEKVGLDKENKMMPFDKISQSIKAITPGEIHDFEVRESPDNPLHLLISGRIPSHEGDGFKKVYDYLDKLEDHRHLKEVGVESIDLQEVSEREYFYFLFLAKRMKTPYSE